MPKEKGWQSSYSLKKKVPKEKRVAIILPLKKESAQRKKGGNHPTPLKLEKHYIHRYIERKNDILVKNEVSLPKQKNFFFTFTFYFFSSREKGTKISQNVVFSFNVTVYVISGFGHIFGIIMYLACMHVCLYV